MDIDEDFERAFWTAASHPAFIHRFRGREHPLLPDNPVSTYLPERLLACIKVLEEDLARPMYPRNKWVLSNSLTVHRSWLRQSMFILNMIH